MNLTELTDAGLHDLSARIAAEWERRRAATVTDQAVTKVITGLQDAGKLSPPPAGENVDTAKPWQDPGADHSAMYRQGAYVTHGGKTWRAKVDHVTHAGWSPSPATHAVWEPVT